MKILRLHGVAPSSSTWACTACSATRPKRRMRKHEPRAYQGVRDRMHAQAKCQNAYPKSGPCKWMHIASFLPCTCPVPSHHSKQSEKCLSLLCVPPPPPGTPPTPPRPSVVAAVPALPTPPLPPRAPRCAGAASAVASCALSAPPFR